MFKPVKVRKSNGVWLIRHLTTGVEWVAYNIMEMKRIMLKVLLPWNWRYLRHKTPRPVYGRP